MSQEKVDRYKQQKANRKEILKKEKRNRTLARIAGGVVCVALVGWVGWSVYGSVNSSSATSQTEVDLNSIQDYLADLQDEGE